VLPDGSRRRVRQPWTRPCRRSGYSPDPAWICPRLVGERCGHCAQRVWHEDPRAPDPPTPGGGLVIYRYRRWRFSWCLLPCCVASGSGGS
jgi:hypothetical protein